MMAVHQSDLKSIEADYKMRLLDERAQAIGARSDLEAVKRRGSFSVDLMRAEYEAKLSKLKNELHEAKRTCRLLKINHEAQAKPVSRSDSSLSEDDGTSTVVAVVGAPAPPVARTNLNTVNSCVLVEVETQTPEQQVLMADRCPVSSSSRTKKREIELMRKVIDDLMREESGL